MGLKLGSDKPAGMKLGSDKPAGLKLGSDRPDGMKLGSDRPAGLKLGSDKPAGIKLGSDRPDGLKLGSAGGSASDGERAEEWRAGAVSDRVIGSSLGLSPGPLSFFCCISAGCSSQLGAASEEELTDTRGCRSRCGVEWRRLAVPSTASENCDACSRLFMNLRRRSAKRNERHRQASESAAATTASIVGRRPVVEADSWVMPTAAEPSPSPKPPAPGMIGEGKLGGGGATMVVTASKVCRTTGSTAATFTLRAAPRCVGVEAATARVA